MPPLFLDYPEKDAQGAARAVRKVIEDSEKLPAPRPAPLWKRICYVLIPEKYLNNE